MNLCSYIQEKNIGKANSNFYIMECGTWISVTDVVNAHLEQGADVVVVQGIIYSFALAPVFDDAKCSQDSKLMGYGRFALAAKYGKIAYTMFPIQKGRDYFYAGRISQGLEYLGKALDGIG